MLLRVITIYSRGWHGNASKLWIIPRWRDHEQSSKMAAKLDTRGRAHMGRERRTCSSVNAPPRVSCRVCPITKAAVTHSCRRVLTQPFYRIGLCTHSLLNVSRFDSPGWQLRTTCVGLDVSITFEVRYFRHTTVTYNFGRNRPMNINKNFGKYYHWLFPSPFLVRHCFEPWHCRVWNSSTAKSWQTP